MHAMLVILVISMPIFIDLETHYDSIANHNAIQTHNLQLKVAGINLQLNVDQNNQRL